MPMHDWRLVRAGTYHNFHLQWVASILDRLNAGLLPPGFFAMAEQMVGQPEADVVTLQSGWRKPNLEAGGVATAPEPKTRFVLPMPDEDRYARKANRIAVHHGLGEVVAVIELVSPGNKDRKHSLETFVAKAVDLIRQQVNLLIVDPFPPGPHDPQGIHPAISEDFLDQPFALPADKPLTMVSYQVEPMRTAYVEPIAVGDRLPDMPLFLAGDFYVSVPLEETYQATWNVLPMELRKLVEPC